MKTKDQIAMEKYGKKYSECCWAQQSRIDGIFIGQDGVGEK